MGSEGFSDILVLSVRKGSLGTPLWGARVCEGGMVKPYLWEPVVRAHSVRHQSHFNIVEKAS